MNIVVFKRIYASIVIALFVTNYVSAQNPVPREKGYLSVMENRLSAEDKEFLKMIYEPVVVGTPPSNARAYVCIMPDGELRSYGNEFTAPESKESIEIYLSSTDCGLTWKKHFTKPSSMGPATFFPQYGIWMKGTALEDGGTGALVSKTGPDDTAPDTVRIMDKTFVNLFLPHKLETSSRIYFTGEDIDDPSKDRDAGYFYSDDTCRSFKYAVVKQPDQHKVAYPHKGLRWSVGCGTEPVVCQMDSTTMMMLLRNSTDCFYQSFSTDEGTTWTTPQPSPFNGTDTTPYILALADGRIITFWNNTRPLPEEDHTKQKGADRSVIDGTAEDYFTNRDAAHAAISDDCGRTWKGAREIFLNPVRNQADFRYFGGKKGSSDKSVHQFQAIELPFNKVLVILGQNDVSRRMLIFDVNWLYETERFEDFYTGLDKVSTHVFIKSEVGHTHRNGHCNYNRTNGAVKAIDPVSNNRYEVVQVSRIDDPRLVNQTQGLVWNFPAALEGEVEIELYLAQDAVNISFDDSWSNPCDQYEPEQSLFTFHIDDKVVKMKEYHKLKFVWNIETEEMEMFIDGKFSKRAAMQNDCNIGLSYVNIQCDAPAKSEGVYIRNLEKR